MHVLVPCEMVCETKQTKDSHMKVDGLAEKTVENEQCVGFDADDNMKEKIKI